MIKERKSKKGGDRKRKNDATKIKNSIREFFVQGKKTRVRYLSSLNDSGRLDHVSQGLGHFSSIPVQHEAMGNNFFVRGLIRGSN
jgi:hypothetical protein